MSGLSQRNPSGIQKAQIVTTTLQGFVILLLVGLIALFAITSHRYTSYRSAIREDALWHGNQLDRDVRRLYEGVLGYIADDYANKTDLLEIASAYDILYSQIGVVEETTFQNEFIKDGVNGDIRYVRDWITANTGLFDQINEGYVPTTTEIQALRVGLDDVISKTTRLVTATITDVHRSRSDARDTITSAKFSAAMIILALIVSITVLLWLLRRQLHAMRLAAAEQEQTSSDLRVANAKLSDKAEWLRGEVEIALADLRNRDIEIVDILSLAASYKDSELGSHTRRVGAYSELIARHLGLPSDVCADIRLASPMHDIGKVAIPDAVLLKAGPLSDDEFVVMQRHTVVGGQILSESKSPLLQLAADIAKGHHEHWNGRGYPNNASGEMIPLSARIVAVADTFDALTTIRPYKIAWPRERAIDYILERSGDQFDPECVEAFRRALPEVVSIMDEEMIAVA